jgi:hypothetical protein
MQDSLNALGRRNNVTFDFSVRTHWYGEMWTGFQVM